MRAAFLKSPLAWLLPLALAGSTAVAQTTPFQVKDINTTQTGGTYLWPFRSEVVELNGLAYFTVSDGVHGIELWRSNGTAAGTGLVLDLCPGACSSVPRSLTVVGTTLYFAAEDGARGVELWKSDGTAAGTVLVKDILPGLGSSTPINLFELNGALFFSAEEAVNGRELWTSDGTPGGTVLVKDIKTGSGGSAPRPWGRLGSTMLLSAEDDAHGLELWKTDGTGPGTALVKDIWPGTGASNAGDWAEIPGYATSAVSGGRLFFSASDGVAGAELWVSDGTAAGTMQLKDINPGADDSWPGTVLAFGSKILFRADDGTHGFELWASDGTESGTVQVKDISPGATGSTPWEITAMGGWAWFRANDGTHGSELWRTDGTEVNTGLVVDIQTGSASGIPVFGPAGITAIGSQLVFFADDGVRGLEPWTTNGTTTALLADINAAGSSEYQLTPIIADRRAVVGGQWYFRAFDSAGDLEVYVSNGTPAGTGQLAEINNQTSSFEPTFLGTLFGANPLADLNGSLFFQASDGVDGAELWKSDGTPAGTQQVADIFPGPSGSYPHEITALGNDVVFSAESGFPPGRELWISDGSGAGTDLLKDLEPSNTTSGGSPWWITRAGSFVFLNGYDGTTEQLWQTDGTTGGTGISRTAAPTAVGPTELTALGGLGGLGGLLLYSGTGPDGTELWRTDGTSPGTVQLADIALGTASSAPDRLTRVGSRIFFSAADGTGGTGRELWITDGTSPGTHPVKDIAPGAASGIQATVDDTAFRLEHWAAASSRLFFPADDGTTGEELWVSDGTAAGTHLVLDIFPGARSSEIRWLTAAGTRALFVADDGVHGRELWTSDGTAAGTRIVFDFVPGADSSSPEQLLAVNDGLLFSGYRNPGEGRELWYTDRDGLYTRVLTDINPGAEPSSPQSLIRSGSSIYFAATNGTDGFELYSVPLEDVDGGLDFFTVTPCRLIDTRLTGGALASGSARRVQVAGPCGIPASARALAVNLTVINPTNQGNLQLYRDHIQAPGTTALNFAAGEIRANNSMVENGEGGVNVRASLAGGTGQVHFTLDVTGYYE